MMKNLLYIVVIALFVNAITYSEELKYEVLWSNPEKASKLNLNFTEMRPVYEQDQSRDELIGTVGY